MTGRRIQSSDNGMNAAPDLSAMAVRATFGNDHAEAPASEVYRIKDEGRGTTVSLPLKWHRRCLVPPAGPAGPNAPDACAGPSVWVGPGADYRLPRASINALQILCEYTQQPIPTIRR